VRIVAARACSVRQDSGLDHDRSGTWAAGA
jgi:hypothetical protein